MVLKFVSLLLAAELHFAAAKTGAPTATTAAPAYDKTQPPPGAAATAAAASPRAGSQQLPRTSGLVQNIDQIYSGGGKVGYLLYAGGSRFLLDLERDELVGPQTPVQHPRGWAHCYYRGTVDGSSQSLAVFNLCGGLDGYFAVKHARYTVKPLLRAKGAAPRRVYGPGSALIPHLFLKDHFSFETRPAQPQWAPRAAIAPGPFAPLGAGRRSRRSISRARQVELLLVADGSMAKKYGKGLQHYLLTLATIASRLYGHASIENHIRLAVVKVVVLGDKEKGLEVNKNAATTLKNFCKWQHQHNPLEDEHEEHYDAAILFTREVGHLRPWHPLPSLSRAQHNAATATRDSGL
uniref:Uncharacterized protein n=1 Tax=Gopherus agassizii TaxID=38772 RepID=A0A452ICI9_9SAUR